MQPESFDASAEQPAESSSGAAQPGELQLIQELVEDHLDAVPRRFSADFLALAGSWEDDRSTEEILRDIEESRLDAERPELA